MTGDLQRLTERSRLAMILSNTQQGLVEGQHVGRRVLTILRYLEIATENGYLTDTQVDELLWNLDVAMGGKPVREMGEE